MCCPIPNVFLKSSSHRLVHPVEEKGEEDEEEADEEQGKTCVCVCVCRYIYRITEPWESISLPFPDCRKLPELPTTAQLRQREGRGPKSTVGGEMTWNIFDITPSRVWSLPDLWRPCWEVEHIALFFKGSINFNNQFHNLDVFYFKAVSCDQESHTQLIGTFNCEGETVNATNVSEYFSTGIWDKVQSDKCVA